MSLSDLEPNPTSFITGMDEMQPLPLSAETSSRHLTNYITFESDPNHKSHSDFPLAALMVILVVGALLLVVLIFCTSYCQERFVKRRDEKKKQQAAGVRPGADVDERTICDSELIITHDGSGKLPPPDDETDSQSSSTDDGVPTTSPSIDNLEAYRMPTSSELFPLDSDDDQILKRKSHDSAFVTIPV